MPVDMVTTPKKLDLKSNFLEVIIFIESYYYLSQTTIIVFKFLDTPIAYDLLLKADLHPQKPVVIHRHLR